VSGPDSANRSVREQFAPADEPWDRLGQVNTASVCARSTPNKLRRLIKANGWVRLSAAKGAHKHGRYLRPAASPLVVDCKLGRHLLPDT